MRDAGSAEPRADRVVFDMDGTLMYGDSGAQLIHHLIERNLWRRVLAVVIAPLGFALMAIASTRRVGVSMFFWVATVGTSESQFNASVVQFVATHAPQRIEIAISAVQAALDSGADVTIATGAFQALAEQLVATLQLRGAPRVVGSTIRRFGGGFVARLQANGIFKLQRLAECGVEPPFACAWSDSRADLPLLCAARETHWVTSRAVAARAVRKRLPGVIVHTIARSSLR